LEVKSTIDGRTMPGSVDQRVLVVAGGSSGMLRTSLIDDYS
jgi:hypothetical protein